MGVRSFYVDVTFQLEAEDEDSAFRKVDGMLDRLYKDGRLGKCHYEMFEGAAYNQLLGHGVPQQHE